VASKWNKATPLPQSPLKADSCRIKDRNLGRKGGDHSIGRGLGGVERGSVAHGIDVSEDLAGGLDGKLRAGNAQAMKPTPDADRGRKQAA
jgi:hypothetical protein